ncbi:expressed unknown protein [Seminavis robusta]|uniref:START domain-containing protein n=1 Tax=Seminavis robusta TaxID=568900 RepID=A0A9N8H864_9STRA|nr:expressed unknown protein [Seminavis robusta]|eukprot:Sro160_g072140.1 n/a (536) ;mRNA; r:46322-47929
MIRISRWCMVEVVLLLAFASVLAAASSISHLPTASSQYSRNCKNGSREDDGLTGLLLRSLQAGRQGILTAHSHPIWMANRRGSYQNHAAVVSHYDSLQVSILKKVFRISPMIVSKIRNYNPPVSFGQYYGLAPDKIFPYQSTAKQQKDSEMDKQLAMTQTLSETLEEMRNMRKELQILRREMYEMRKKITGEQDLEFEGAMQEEEEVDPEVARLAQQKKQRYFERLGREVEKWARQKLFEEPRVGDGWVEVPCNKMVRKTANPNGNTQCYLTWLPDSRGKNAFADDKKDYPCIKVYSVLDAPLEDVCTYLSREEHMTDYNVILSAQRDLEEIAPHCKISWATSPQVLFVKPREFVTFVYHRWLKDGSVVLINQAVDHKDAPAVTEEGKGTACRGYALRGATFFSPDPQDPQKTRVAMISHAAPGGNLPGWAVKTAIGAIAPLEPFKLFNYINEEVHKKAPEIEKLKMKRMEQASAPGRSNQPVGMAQIGFACFWPNGGGLAPASPPSSTSGGAESGSMQPKVTTGEEEPVTQGGN